MRDDVLKQQSMKVNWRVLANHSLYPSHENIINIEFQTLKLNQNLSRMHECVNFLWKCQFILDVAASVTPHEFHLKRVSTLGFFLALGVEKVPFIPASPGNLEKKCYCFFFFFFFLGFRLANEINLLATIKCFPPSYFLGITPSAQPPCPRIRRARSATKT